MNPGGFDPDPTLDEKYWIQIRFDVDATKKKLLYEEMCRINRMDPNLMGRLSRPYGEIVNKDFYEFRTPAPPPKEKASFQKTSASDGPEIKPFLYPVSGRI